MNLFNIRKTFQMKEARGWNEIYFCIDLHGTIIPSGESVTDSNDEKIFYPYAKEVLKYLSDRKDIKIILWTSTPPMRIMNVLKWFMDNEIYFDGVNSNRYAANTPRSNFDEKFYFNVLLDDRAGFDPETDWKAIKDELIAIGEWKV